MMAHICCSNCQIPMRRLSLDGHYHQAVEIDICENCSLIWFDHTESVKLAGPGIADIVRVIHAGLSKKNSTTLSDVLPCPICQANLSLVHNQTRFGRTRHLECPEKHGYLQTFVLYLAEKGFVRPMRWADVKHTSGHAQGQQLFCAGCGAGLDDGLYEACPYCRSTIGVIDPARLASAIDIQQAAARTDFLTEVEQNKCWSCGASVDETREIHCTSCHVILRSKSSHRAIEASASVEAQVRQNYAQQMPVVSIQKLEQAELYNAMTSSLFNKFDTHKGAALRKFIRPILAIFMLGLLAAGAFNQKLASRVDKKPVNAEQFSEKVASVEAQLTSPDNFNASSPSQVFTTPVATESSQGNFEEMFSFPKLVCAADAPSRVEVKIRQIIVTPEKLADTTSGAVDHRKAYLQLQQARLVLMNGTPFDQVLLQYGSRGTNAQPLSKYFKKGSTKAEIERMAFCLPINEISPIFLTSEGFHLLQVLETR
jgi:uncharacterized protein YbaR (Trm112 family)/parvulin-like peptidyl-prolyl isomerase